MKLFHTVVGEGPRVGIVVHGILGSGLNWRTFARRLVATCPDWRLVLVDLRNHGRTNNAEPPHTVAACVEDLRQLADSLGTVPSMLVGHSFGGKVALAYAAAHPYGLSDAWVLDANPGPLDGLADRSEVLRVLGALRGVPQPLARRDDLVEHLLALGFSRAIALWMTTNLMSTAAGYVWRFDLDGVEQMIADYFRLDLWPVLTTPPPGVTIHVVRAEHSDRWTPEELARFAALPSPGPVRLHLLPDSGHWVHVDNPEGLLAMMKGCGVFQRHPAGG